MLFDLSIIPIGKNVHLSSEIAEALKIVSESGLPYILTPTGTCIEGEWDDVLNVIRNCHDRVRQLSPHVMTMIKIEDDEGDHEKLKHNVESVAEKAGPGLHTTQSMSD